MRFPQSGLAYMHVAATYFRFDGFKAIGWRMKRNVYAHVFSNRNRQIGLKLSPTSTNLRI